MTEAAELSFDDLAEGATFEARYAIDAAAYDGFLAAFGDRSPIHVDDAYARERGFSARVMHGTIINGFVSHFVGMRVPGKRALLQSVDLQYLRPSYFGDAIVIRATVAQRAESARTVVLHVHVHNETRGVAIARGRVQVGVAE